MIILAVRKAFSMQSGWFQKTVWGPWPAVAPARWQGAVLLLAIALVLCAGAVGLMRVNEAFPYLVLMPLMALTLGVVVAAAEVRGKVLSERDQWLIRLAVLAGLLLLVPFSLIVIIGVNAPGLAYFTVLLVAPAAVSRMAAAIYFRRGRA